MRNGALRNRRRAADDDDTFDRPAAPRPWWWRIVLRRPTDSVAVLVALACATAIVVNAAYLQHGRHPAPMFALRPLPVAVATPADIVGVVAHPREPAPEERHEGASAHGHAEPAERGRGTPASAPTGVPAHKDPIAELLATHAAQPQAQPPGRQAALPPPRPPEPLARPSEPPARSAERPSRQVLAVQRALSDFGYGQLRPTGVYDAETKAAVQRFEREHNLPVTDEISEPMKHTLATLTGRELN